MTAHLLGAKKFVVGSERLVWKGWQLLLPMSCWMGCACHDTLEGFGQGSMPDTHVCTIALLCANMQLSLPNRTSGSACTPQTDGEDAHRSQGNAPWEQRIVGMSWGTARHHSVGIA